MTNHNDEGLLARLTDELMQVGGVRAIALGGSRSRGLATDSSDYDIGLYYDPEVLLDVDVLGRTVASMDDRGSQPASRLSAAGADGSMAGAGSSLAEPVWTCFTES